MSIAKVAWILIALSALTFVLAAVASWLGGSIAGIIPEAYSRASNNMALICIALLLVDQKK